MKKYIITMFIAFGLLVGFVPAANADTSVKLTVLATSYDKASVKETVKVTNETSVLVNGATQLVWWYPNHNIKVSAASIKKAPYIKVSYSSCAVQSKSIAKQAHSAPIVVAKVGSQICNTGKDGKMVGGFKFTATKGPAVLKWNPTLKLYQHVFNLVKPSNVQRGDTVVGYMTFKGVRVAIVKVCGNHMGGHVDKMVTKVVQVRYAQDVRMSGKLNVDTAADVKVDFELTCPNGAHFKVSASAGASGHADASINYTMRTRETVIGANKVSLSNTAQGNMSANAESAAAAKIDVEASCGDVPPPSYSSPTASGQANACVVVGQQNGVITALGTNPNNVAAPGTLVVGGKSQSFASVGAGQSVTADFSGFAPGTYNGSFTLGAPINKSATFQVTVNACPVVEHQNPTAEIFVGEHAVDLNGTMPVFGRAKAFDGATVSLGSPMVTPSDLGGIYNWRTVSTERDGVTPCETGYVCYQGYFRVTKAGTPGTTVYGSLVATATDTKNGSFTTQPLQFAVAYVAHPET